MTERFGKKHILFYVSVAGFFISSATVWFIPLISFDEEVWQKILAYIVGALFWLGLIIGITFLILVNRMRKKVRHKKSIPFITFFSNKIAMIFDIGLIVGFIGFFPVLFIKTLNQWLAVAIIFTLIFSLEMHGVFNGENYKFISNKKPIFKNDREGK